MELTAEEARVIGCLVEKQLTVPDSYPLTLNGVVTACNQSSNRSPVVHYDEGTATAALTSLRERGLTRIVYSQSNRAPKHRHVLDDVLRLDRPELAVLTVLVLRGPQTAGELRTRTERMHPFGSLDEVDTVIDGLAAHDEPLVVRVPRQAGQKEGRVAHLLCGPVDVDSLAAAAAAAAGQTSEGGGGLAGPVARSDRLAALEAEVRDLREQVLHLYRVLGETPPAGE